MREHRGGSEDDLAGRLFTISPEASITVLGYPLVSVAQESARISQVGDLACSLGAYVAELEFANAGCQHAIAALSGDGDRFVAPLKN